MSRPPAAKRCYVCGSPAAAERRLVDVRTAMRVCRVSRATVYRWMFARQVEWIRRRGRRRIFLDSLFKDPPRRVDWLA